MKLKRSPSLPVLMGLLALAGAAAVVYGIYLLFGLPESLIAGGLAAVGAGLFVDVE